MDAPAIANDATEQWEAGTRQDSSHQDLETIYRSRCQEMIRYLVRFGVERAEAEDITHEVFLDILGGMQNRKAPHNLFRWALVCARNLAINRYRRYRREGPVLAGAWNKWEDALPDLRANAELHFQQEERYRKMVKWISTLSDVERECVMMRSQGLPFREMAVVLDLPMRRVIYITGIAIRKLKRQRECQA